MTSLFKSVFIGGPLCGNDLETDCENLPRTIDVPKNGRIHRYRIKATNKEPYFQFLHLGSNSQENMEYENPSDNVESEGKAQGVWIYGPGGDLYGPPDDKPKHRSGDSESPETD